MADREWLAGGCARGCKLEFMQIEMEGCMDGGCRCFALGRGVAEMLSGWWAGCSDVAVPRRRLNFVEDVFSGSLCLYLRLPENLSLIRAKQLEKNFQVAFGEAT